MDRLPNWLSVSPAATVFRGLDKTNVQAQLGQVLFIVRSPGPMNTYSKLALSAFCAIGGAVIATLVTVEAWNIQIEPRAFQCGDEMGWLFNIYWVDIDVHRQAGDKISPGWTWAEINEARWIYIEAFLVILGACTVGAFKLIYRQLKRTETSRKAVENRTGNG